MRPTFVRLALLAPLALLTGCGGAQRADGIGDPAPPAPRIHELTTTGAFVWQWPAPASLMPHEARSGAVLRTVGDRESLHHFTFTRSGDAWLLDVEGLRRTFYRLRDGEVVVGREDDLLENARVEYEPAIVVLPRDGAETREQRVTMRVLTLDGSKQRDRGTMVYRVDVLGSITITTPAGGLTAVALRSVREIDLNLADVRVESLEAYAPGDGPVAEWSQREVRMLGLFTTRSAERLERAPRAGAPGG